MGIVNRIASTLRAPAEAVLRYASDDDVFILGGEPSNDAGDHRPASDLPGATSVYRAMSPVYKGVQFRSNALAQIPLELVDAEGQPTRPTHPVAAALRLMDQFRRSARH